MSFYVAGCQRSGTTLLRLILNSHSQITCFDEAVSYETFLGLQTPEELILEDHLIGYKIPRFAEQLLLEVVSDTDYPHVPQFFNKDDDEVIFITRDVLDVVSSMKTLTFDDGLSWLQKYGLETLKFKMNDESFCNKYKTEIKQVEETEYNEAAVGALYWKFKNDALFEYQQAGLKLLSLKYETLVSSPRTEITRIVEFLNIEFEDSLLNHHKIKHSEIGPDGKAIGGTDPGKAISTSSVGRYVGILSESEIQIIHGITGSLEDSLAHV
ncbi:sulfotransferase family protein [Gimesia algae]|uniref:Sulfotransferase domain protein n=1 Tax=Gimesia algae TaxID=2527971 RepID=A0A517VJ45_9PLAN|nr:sulfotransferase [Gimesia algae]QDT93026.1 Sulfotransferase domain protein [Gimesia algae]